MHSHVIRTIVLLAALACLAEPTEAQTEAAGKTPAPLSPNDSIFRRARRLVSDGNGASGRALVDSMVRVSTEGTPQYGDAIFWRGALAETAAEAERDYRRVIVEYPLSPYADDALLSLAELEQARGDRTAAYQHLQRFVREHPVSPARARAGLAAARLAFEQRDMTRGCVMIADARTSVGTSDVELRNQIEYYGSRCPTTASTPPTGPAVVASGAPTAAAPAPTPAAPTTAAPSATVPSSAAPRATAPRASAPSTSTPKSAPPTRSTSTKPDSARAPVASPAPRGTWTIQLAAYNTRPEAERLVTKLAGRGVKARISGDAKPFRVRLDFYATRQEAATAVAELKARGIIGFVTEEVRSSPGSAP
jgi:septal ring-binding cell division protein DamX